MPGQSGANYFVPNQEPSSEPDGWLGTGACWKNLHCGGHLAPPVSNLGPPRSTPSRRLPFFGFAIRGLLPYLWTSAQRNSVMRSLPSIVPAAPDDVYLVLDNLGARLGRAWRETDEESADRRSLVIDLIDGQYSDPVRIIAFNTA